VPDGFDTQRGVILVGGLHGVDPASIAELRARTGWPVLADPTSRIRHLDGVVTTADALLRHPRFAQDHVPTTIVRVGRPAASKVLAQWTASAGATLIQVGGPGVIDPDRAVTARCAMDDLLAAAPTGATGTPWAARWDHAERRADRAITDALASFGELTEPQVARIVAEQRSPEVDVTVASSMPVRDLEWFGGRSAEAHANRGANGIDGVVSTALGRALGRRRVGAEPGVALVGDLAFVHDSNALVALATRGVDLRVVVVDNDGGGIFSFLPQAERLDPDRFEALFGTPLGSDVAALTRAHGVPAATVDSASELTEQLRTPGPRVVRVATNRARNVEVHATLHRAVAQALR
jgi:2-succinyl-5-enolpyruvyl-6-hydroxy-3-cyclohexene-1-carboxylate synthase